PTRLRRRVSGATFANSGYTETVVQLQTRRAAYAHVRRLCIVEIRVMNCQSYFQIHFYTEYDASASIDVESYRDNEGFCEILLFSCLALRQLHNLRSNRVSITLAEILSAMYSKVGNWSDFFDIMTGNDDKDIVAYYLPFIAALGFDVSRLVGLIPSLALYKAVQKIDNEQLAREISPNIARVTDFRGRKGRKQFHANVEVRGANRLIFNLKPVGFGILGRGVNYYAPMSVVLAFQYLLSSHEGTEPGDIKFRKVIKQVAHACGDAFLRGKVTSTSQLSLPLDITVQAFSDAA
ncbi:MAG: hypothetical protein D6732_03165, partial [Methanobacteriota archaeon]